MYRFDWRAFCDAHRIPYVEKGAHTSKGNINIACPMCGAAETSHHMGLCLDVDKPLWGCWKSRGHAGLNPVPLIQALLGCDLPGAMKELERFGSRRPVPYTPLNLRVTTPAKPLHLPSFFFPIRAQHMGSLFWNYLYSQRRFPTAHIAQVAAHYKLHYCTIGDWSMRLIIPVYFQGQLANWTGRTILKSEVQPLRYKTLSHDEDAKPRALHNIKNLLLDFDFLAMNKGHALVICEGPLDAMKINFYGRNLKIFATCLFGNSMSTVQATLLARLGGHFTSLLVLLDADAKLQAIQVASELAAIHPRVAQIDMHGPLKDPGALDMGGVIKLLGEITSVVMGVEPPPPPVQEPA